MENSIDWSYDVVLSGGYNMNTKWPIQVKYEWERLH